MKPTIKASIGGYAFNLEEDAYIVMEQYISSLKNHFKDKEEGYEIIHDLELRIAELLQLKMKESMSIISINDVQDIINIMGTPKDITEEDTIHEESNFEKEFEQNTAPIKKGLFRDGDNSILGGVCSGFARYFNIDPLLIRISYVLVFLFSGIIYPGKTRLLLILLYAVLWIIMPKAKTFKQKVAMRGTPPPVQSIEKREEIHVQKPKGSGILSFIKIFFGIILGIICLTIIIAIAAGLGAYWGFFGGNDFPGINLFVEVLGLKPFDFGISAIILFIFPLLFVLTVCLKLLFQSPFKKSDAVGFILGLIIWIGAGFYLAGTSWKLISKHEYKAKEVQIIPADVVSDTLYVRLTDKVQKAVHLNHVTPPMMYIKGRNNNHSLILYPKIRINEIDSTGNFKIELKKIAFDSNKSLAREKAERATLDYYLDERLFIITPHIYNRKSKWDREIFEITIFKPKGKTVICKGTLQDI